MKTFYQYITEATAEKDQAFIDEAEFVFQKLLEDCHTNKQKNYFTDTTSDPPRYGVNLGTVTANKLYDNIYVVFAEKNLKTQGVFARIKGTQTQSLGLFYLQPIDYKANSPVWSAFVRDYKQIRTTFIHEFIHFLDYTRMGSDRWSAAVSGTTNSFSTKVNPTIYYNQPLEFNAFYQQGAATIQGTIKSLFMEMSDDIGYIKTFIEKYKEMFSNNFNDFYNFSLKMNVFEKGYIQALTAKNKKKLMSRYYSLYTDILSPKLNKLKVMVQQYDGQSTKNISDSKRTES